MLHKPMEFPPIRRLNSAVSEDLEQVIMKAIELEPSARYQSAEEMQSDLLKCLQQNAGAE